VLATGDDCTDELAAKIVKHTETCEEDQLESERLYQWLKKNIQPREEYEYWHEILHIATTRTRRTGLLYAATLVYHQKKLTWSTAL
jgi:hypothetical protein